MINSIILKYNANIDRIQTILKSIKDIGINMPEVESVLNDITDEVDSKITALGTIGFTQKDNVNNIYQYGIDKTNKLLVDLEKYNDYYQAINKCYYIEGTQNIIEINEEELGVVVDDVITLLKTINAFDGLAENNDSIIEKLYDFIYNLIKTEFCFNSTSGLLSYCKDNEVDRYFINKCMFKEIESLKESKQDISKIESILSKKVLLNNTSSIIDEELLQVISSLKDKDKYAIELLDKLSSLINKLDLIDSRLLRLFNRKNEFLDEIDECRGNYRLEKSRNSKTIIRNILPLALTTITLLGGNVGLTIAAKGTDYRTDIQTFSSQTGETISSEEYISRIREVNGVSVDNVVLIDVKGPWEKKAYKDGSGYFERKVNRTAISGVELDDLEDYINLDLENTDANYEESVYIDKYEKLDNSDKYSENITEVIKQNQDPNDSRLGNNIDFGGIVFINFLLLCLESLLIFLLEVLTSDMNFDNGIATRFQKARRELRKIKYSTFNKKEWMEKLIGVDNDIKNLIQENEDVRRRYLELINNPKYKLLLDEYEYKTSVIRNYLERIDNGANLSLSKKM